MNVRILDRAERDLEEGAWFYERQSPGLGSYFLDSLDLDIASLTKLAGIHRKIYGHHQLLSKKFPYAIYYEVVGNVALINAVIDCRSDPQWIREKLTKR